MIINSVFYELRPESLFIGAFYTQPFPSHVHNNVEIVCITSGWLNATVAGAQLHLLTGDILVLFPFVPHSFDAVSPDVSGLTLHFDPKTIQEFSHTFRTTVPISAVLRCENKVSELDWLTSSLIDVSSRENSPLLLGYLHLFLSHLFICLPLRPVAKYVQADLSYQVLRYISEHFTESLSLDSVAHDLGISSIHLSHLFSQHLHVNFRQFINTLRINRACVLLRDSAYSVSQITELCGYGNARTFHRAFLAQCGVPPNQYRASLTLPDERNTSTIKEST